MARQRVRNRRSLRPDPDAIPVESNFKDIELLVVLMIASAETEDEEETAILIAALCEDERRQASIRRRSGKYGARGLYETERCQALFDYIMERASERWFKAWFRMDQESFWRIHDLISDDEVFLNTGRKPQRPIRFQLAAFLSRMGADSVIKTAGFVAISDGSVHNYCTRVVRAVRNMRGKYVGWPGFEQRDVLSEQADAHGFPGCLGSGDGSYLRLFGKPGIGNGYAYYCHKKFYALIIQATADFRGIITSYEFGWPGSVQDSRVFKLSHLWERREQYFRQHEYILVDKGYPLTPFSIRPFNDNDLTADPAEASRRKRWNRKLSSLRIFIEHAFGRLKGRFQWLRCIPYHNVLEAYRTIEALIVLHNFLEARDDDPTTIEGFHGKDEADVNAVLGGDVPEHLSLIGDDLYRAGLLRRKLLLDYTDESDNE